MVLTSGHRHRIDNFVSACSRNIETLVIAVKAGNTAGTWAEQRFLQSGACDIHSKDLNFKACEKIMKETVDMYGKINDHFTAMVEATKVLMLTVPRMTY